SADPVRAARALRLQGECAAVQGDSAAARNALDKAVALTPRDPVAYNSRGYYAYAHFDKHHEAVEDYDRAIKLNPNYSYAFNNRGWSRYRMGDREQALKDINKAARRKVFNPFVYRNLGIITLEQGDTLKACGHFRKALSYGFTALYGPEVEDLMKGNCGRTEPAAPVQAPNAPLPPRSGKPPVRSNAP
ncbi:MAG TPA: tetratricopeptide repeat protein, partial [Flavobacteriales bacterium]